MKKKKDKREKLYMAIGFIAGFVLGGGIHLTIVTQNKENNKHEGSLSEGSLVYYKPFKNKQKKMKTSTIVTAAISATAGAVAASLNKDVRKNIVKSVNWIKNQAQSLLASEEEEKEDDNNDEEGTED